MIYDCPTFDLRWLLVTIWLLADDFRWIQFVVVVIWLRWWLLRLVADPLPIGGLRLMVTLIIRFIVPFTTRCPRCYLYTFTLPRCVR